MTVKHWNTGASAERYRANERASEHNNKITILWGSDKAPENKETYTFDNKEQLDYFMMGVGECDGWLEYEVQDDK
tara:strand:- start:58 stop:282 length:225 start_codon:yes stop_codon:yes gene_type:complete